MAKDPRKVMERWSRNTANATEKYKDGIADVKESPGVTAANHIDDYRTGVLEALNDGRTEAGMRSVNLGDWQKAASGRGAQNLASSVNDQQVKDKMQQALSVILPYTENVKETVRRMPKGTKEDRKARMLKAFDMMSQLRVKNR